MTRVRQEEERLLPAGRDLRFESPCKVKRFLALAAEEPDWLAEASAEVWKREEAGVSAAARRREAIVATWNDRRQWRKEEPCLHSEGNQLWLLRNLCAALKKL